MSIQRVRGTADLFDNDILVFEYILEVVKNLAKKFSFNQLITPIIEKSEVFYRTLGDSSDIVNKETYSFLDRDKKSLTLRPEFTAAVVRAVVENGMLNNLPLKLFSHGPLFRHERPQKCRMRQFHQFNFEYIGAPSVNVDLELLLMAETILKKLGLDNIRLYFNSLGSPTDRAKYKAKLVEYLARYTNDLSALSKQRLVQNPLRILDSKESQDQEIIANAPIISSFINSEEQKKLDYIAKQLDFLKIDFQLSPKLVRGLDYYSGFVFEFITEDLGSQGTVIAGGRYNYLIQQLGGADVPATGFAGGFERIMALLAETKGVLAGEQSIYLIPIGETAEKHAVLLAHDLRTKHNFSVDLHYDLSLKKRMKKANKLKFSHVIIFGDTEIKAGYYSVKDMKTGVESKVSEHKLAQYLTSLENE